MPPNVSTSRPDRRRRPPIGSEDPYDETIFRFGGFLADNFRMCQLFAFDSHLPATASFALAGFAARGGETAEHADGWGVAFHAGDQCRLFVEPRRACDSPLASQLVREPIRAERLIAHVRKATQGAVDPLNCHPFRRVWRGRTITFCHNGDLKGFTPDLPSAWRPSGQTDSERAFGWLMWQLDRSLPGPDAPEPADLAAALLPLADALADHGVFNFLLCDGRATSARACTRLHWLERRPPFGWVRLVDRDLSIDLSRANGPADRMALIATEPLTHDEPWTAFEPGELRVFAGGRTVWHSGRVAALA